MFKSPIVVLVVYVALTNVAFGQSNGPTVQLSHGGYVRGTQVQTVKNLIFDAFFGIPYAKPPLGDLRFKSPKPITWSGTRNATTKSDPCIQYDIASGMVIGKEDCLYLNVFRPRNRPQGLTLPVMVWIHGGAYQMESTEPYGPDRLLDNDVIYASLSYRLGALGFLSTGTPASPGNFGLKDQQLALKWVKKNIGAFGGNPNRITIFGQSAGAASVSLHMAVPSSAGLFHKAILQSGNYFDPWAIVSKEKAESRAKKVAQEVNCTTVNSANMINCLRLAPADDIVNAQISVYYWLFEPVVVWGPVIEAESPDAFLTQDPREMDEIHGIEIPIIIGANSEDGAVKSAPLIFNSQIRAEFEQRFEEVVPHMLFYDDKLQAAAITDRIQQYYFGGRFEWNAGNEKQLTDMFTHRLFFAGMDQFLRQRFNARGRQAGNTNVYIFNHNGPVSGTVAVGGGTNFYGVSHWDELPFIFPYGQLNIQSKIRDKQMYYAMPKMWTSFAQSSNPTPLLSLVRETWSKTTSHPQRYAKIGSVYLGNDETSPSQTIKDMIENLLDRIGLIDTCSYSNRRIYSKIVCNKNGNFWDAAVGDIYN